MPNPKLCNRISDPAAKRRCLKYQGEFAQKKAEMPAGVESPWSGNKGKGRAGQY